MANITKFPKFPLPSDAQMANLIEAVQNIADKITPTENQTIAIPITIQHNALFAAMEESRTEEAPIEIDSAGVTVDITAIDRIEGALRSDKHIRFDLTIDTTGAGSRVPDIRTSIERLKSQSSGKTAVEYVAYFTDNDTCNYYGGKIIVTFIKDKLPNGMIAKHVSALAEAV